MTSPWIGADERDPDRMRELMKRIIKDPDTLGNLKVQTLLDVQVFALLCAMFEEFDHVEVVHLAADITREVVMRFYEARVPDPGE